MRTTLASLALLAVLAACGTSDTPGSREPSPASAPTRPVPTATPPVMPDVATEHTAVGAGSFLNYWIETLNYANATGNTTELEALSNPSCAGCNAAIEKIRNAYGAGDYVVGADWHGGEVRIDHSPLAAVITLKVHVDEGRLFKNGDATKYRIPANDIEILVEIIPLPNGWQIAQMGSPEES